MIDIYTEKKDTKDYIIYKHVGILMIMRIVAMHKNISRKLWK